jgi:hypothetical protein
MLWHDDISQHGETIAAADAFERGLEKVSGLRFSEMGRAAVATKSEEVKLSALLEAV